MSEFISNCPKCRQQILCDTAYVGKRVACPVCLQEIIMPAPPQQQSASTASQQGAPGGAAQKKSPMMLIGIIGGAVVVLGGVGAFFAFHKGSGNGSPSPAPVSRPPVVFTAPAAPIRQPVQTPVRLHGGNNAGGQVGTTPPHQPTQDDLDLVLALKNGCIVTTQNGVSDIFSVDPATGSLQVKSNSGSGTAWGTWSRISGDTEKFVGRPAAVCRPDGGEEVFVRKSDHAMGHFYRPSSTGAWSEGTLGGSFAASPSAILNVNGYVEVFATDSDGNLVHNWNSGSGRPWQNWEILASDMKGTPAALCRNDGGAEVFVVKSSGSMGHFAHPSFTAPWNPTSLYGNDFASEPCVVQNANSTVSLFCVKSNGTLWYDYNYGTATPWAGWVQLNIGVSLLSSDLACAVNRSGETEFFGCQSSDRQFGYLIQALDGWSAWGLVPSLPQ